MPKPIPHPLCLITSNFALSLLLSACPSAPLDTTPIDVVPDDSLEAALSPSAPFGSGDVDTGRFAGGPFGGRGDDDPNASDQNLIPLLLTIHMETHTSRPCDDVVTTSCVDEDEWQENLDSLERLLDVLDDAGLKGTFEHQIHWLTHLNESARGRDLLARMIAKHEIGLHHHGITHGDPDYYTNHPDYLDDPNVLGTMDDYLDIVHAFEAEWDYQIVTMEGTDLHTYDGQPEWIYRTVDDENNPERTALVDREPPVCTEGRPIWSWVTLPSNASVNNEYSRVGHTYFGKQSTGSHECVEVESENILARIDDIVAEGDTQEDQAINVVFHPIIDYAVTTDFMSVYDTFFGDVGANEALVPMTVREFMCERAGACE